MAIDPTLLTMIDEVSAADPMYRPSALWDFFNARNLEQLSAKGIERFKATVNQNYYNWVPAGLDDNQMRRLIAFWAEVPSLLPLRARVEDVGIFEALDNPNPFADPERRQLYALFVGLLWHFAERQDRFGVMKQLEEPQVGEPIRIELDGKLISQDIANSVREFTAIMSHMPAARARCGRLRVAELGAGYGRLGYVFAATQPCQYWIFDIPPALHVSQWYLSRVFPGKRIFRFRPFADWSEVAAEVEAADLCFFTPNQLAQVPSDSVDAFVNISSLHEMKVAQIRNFVDLIGDRARHVVYLKQYIKSVNIFDDLTLDKDVYALDSDWTLALDRVDEVHDLFFEQVYTR